MDIRGDEARMYEIGIEDLHRDMADRTMREQMLRDKEDRERGYVDIGGYNVPYNLRDMVFMHGMRPGKVVAVADLFESTADFETSMQTGDTEGRDTRLDEAEARWAAFDTDEVARPIPQE